MKIIHLSFEQFTRHWKRNAEAEVQAGRFLNTVLLDAVVPDGVTARGHARLETGEEVPFFTHIPAEVIAVLSHAREETKEYKLNE